MPSSPADVETIEPSSRVAASLPTRAPVLTIAWHPDLSRVGQRAVLAQLGTSEVVLSRSEPSFLDEGGRSRGALDDPHVSRAPIRLAIQRGALVVDATGVRGAVEIDGEALTGERVIDARRLDAGLVIALSRTVLLVLRRTVPRPMARSRHEMLGASEAMDDVRRGIDVASGHRDPVLLLGESGTGKELVARAIHRASNRAAKPFVAVNMAALGATTAAAELFGHSRGAFTGSDGAHAGYFGRADGGTLFLDEIGDAPEAVQPILLRALETGEIEPVGGRGGRRVDVRVVSATDRDVQREVDERRFRLPLLHRLSSQTISVAPLRDRREDLLPLALAFLREEAPEAGADALPFELAAQLLRRTWPGNVRELRNVARAIAREGAAAGYAKEVLEAEDDAPTRERAAPVTDAQLVQTLRRNGFQIGRTARELGMARNTLYKRMDQCEGLRRGRELGESEIRAMASRCEGDVDEMAARLEVSGRALRLRMRELGIEV